MASLSTLLRAAAKPEPKPKAMVPLAQRRQEAAPMTPGLGSRPTRAVVNKANQAPLTPATPSAQSSRLPATGRNKGAFASEAVVENIAAPLPPKRPPPIKQQVESCFSDQGLKSDVYLQELIRETEDGWVSLDEVMGLKKIKALRCSSGDILHALRESWLETWQDEDGSAAIRRPPNRPMPKLELTQTKKPGVRVADSCEGVVQADTLRRPKDHRSGSDREGVGRTVFPGRLKGVVRTYDEETGSATLASPQTEALFQKDLLVDWRDLEESGAAINIGSLLSFRVVIGTDGEPRARDLELRAPEDDDEDPEAEDAPQPPKRAKVAAVVGQRYIGTIKSFHEGVGLGFIACKATYNTYGRDISVHRVELSGFEVGDEVSFELAAEPGVGTPKAITLEAPSAPKPKPPSSKPPLVAKGVAKAKPAASVGNSRRWKGVIESFDEAKGVGRISCTVNGATRRCILERAELAGFIAGDSVSFKLLKDASGGPPKAIELEAED